jgi:indolepyruvate ferredoxin oxidoreductase beta subunit
VLVGFEPIETVRSLRFASERTLVLMSNKRIPPSELAANKMTYPDMKGIIEKIHRFTGKIITVETERLAREAGSTLTQNIVLIGALAAIENLPVKNESLVEAIRELVPARHMDMNVKAFKLGYEYVKKMRVHA